MNELMFSTRARRRLTGRTGFDMSHIARTTAAPVLLLVPAQVGTTNSTTNNNEMRNS